MPFFLLLRPFMPYILGALAVVAAYFWAYERGYSAAVVKYEQRVNELEATLKTERQMAKQKAEEADKKYRDLEQRWNTKLAEVQIEYEVAQDVTRRKLARAESDNRRVGAELARLRDLIGTYSGGPTGTAESPGPSAGERAATLGHLLQEALGFADEAVSVATAATEGAESAGDSVRVLLKAWPAQAP